MKFNKYIEMMENQYELLKGLYFDDVILKEKYTIYKSNTISDNYWNILSLNQENAFDDKKLLNHIEEDFRKINRQPCIYIPNIIDKNNKYKKYLLNNGYMVNDTDAYMVLIKDNIEIELKNKIERVITKEQFDDFMIVLESAYGGEVSEDNPYSGVITTEYYNAIFSSLKSNQFNHMILYKDKKAICVATLSYKEGYGVINNVGTRKEYQNMGLGKELMKACINKFNELGGGALFLFTESGSKNEAWYSKQGFKTIILNKQFVKNEITK